MCVSVCTCVCVCYVCVCVTVCIHVCLYVCACTYHGCTFVYLSSMVYACVCGIYMGVHVPLCLPRPEKDIRCSLPALLVNTGSHRTGSHLLCFLFRLGWPARPCLWSSCLCPFPSPALRLQFWVAAPGFFWGCWGLKLSSLCLYNRHPTHRAVSSALESRCEM